MTDPEDRQTIPLHDKPHPVLVLPPPELAERDPDEWARYMQVRTMAIHDEAKDPLRHGWEPAIWKVADALLGFPCHDASFLAEIRDRFGPDWDWDRWARAMREAHGFPAPVETLLIMGGNRAGKSQYAAKRSVQVLYGAPKRKVWCMHSNAKMSVAYQQPLINQHMPLHLRDAQVITGRPEYISFKEAIGYTNNRFVTDRRSTCDFLYYSMNRSDAIEGGELDLIWPDELVPADWLDTLRARVATRNGKVVITFTPVEGYTETVRMFVEGATSVRKSIAYLSPDDSGKPLPWAAWGFASPEEQERAKIFGPAAVPEDVHAWIHDPGPGAGQVPCPAGRKFKTCDRILRCLPTHDGDKVGYKSAVIYFHSADNPYGNPQSVYSKYANDPQAKIRERLYGLANKTASARFPRFDPKVHVLPHDKIPTGGTNYLLCDPAGGRNFAFLWFRVVGDTVYVVREWPGNYPIPGVGLPGPWAEMDGTKKDGRRGPAQSPFGFTLLDYKREIARLEGWDLEGQPPDSPALWTPGRKPAERVYERYIDARAGNSATASAEGNFTLQENLEAIGLDFIPVSLGPAGSLSEAGPQSAIHLVNDLFGFDPEKPLDYTNRPRLYISDQCTNTIWACSVWTGEDGQKGACKEWPDLLRYFAAQNLTDIGTNKPYGTVGGGNY